MNAAPLSVQEMQALQQLMHRAQGAGQVTPQPGPGMTATLTPPDTNRRIWEGTEFEEVPVAMPMPWLPIASDIAWGLNDRVQTFTNLAANAESIQRLNFDIPSAVFALTAAVRRTDGNAINGDFGNVLDTFRVQFTLSQGRQWQTNNAMGSAIVGTAQRPRWLGRPCWRFNNGAVLQVRLTPLIANLQVDIVVWALETTGASNIIPTL